jgi:DNA-binding CsgD family transcriptional regulator
VPSAARRLRQALDRALAPAESVSDVMAAAAAVLMPHVGATLSAWSTLDPADFLGTSCYLFDADVAALPIGSPELTRERALFELEWLDSDANTFAALRRAHRTAAALRADVGDPTGVARYRELLAPLGVVDELRVLAADSDGVWGAVILYRSDGVFTPDHVMAVEVCGPALARALRRALLVGAVDRAEVDAPPGVVVVDAHDEIVVTSDAAESLLSELDADHARTAIVAAAAATRITGSLSTTLIGRRGVIGLHAAPAKGVDSGVTIVVERPRPVQLAPVILRSLGLTNREREVAECVLQGFSRREIAARCGISEDTVDDHLKQIYRKADVPGRAALSAAIFEHFYQPHRHHADPSPYGWFLLSDR